MLNTNAEQTREKTQDNTNAGKRERRINMKTNQTTVLCFAMFYGSHFHSILAMQKDNTSMQYSYKANTKQNTTDKIRQASKV